jgi:hypothetical protein
VGVYIYISTDRLIERASEWAVLYVLGEDMIQVAHG